MLKAQESGLAVSVEGKMKSSRIHGWLYNIFLILGVAAGFLGALLIMRVIPPTIKSNLVWLFISLLMLGWFGSALYRYSFKNVLR